jgi:hypothetical protein
MCEQNYDFLNVEAVGNYNNHCRLRDGEGYRLYRIAII